MRCPVCTSSEFHPGDSMFDDRYGEPNIYRIDPCAHCGHLVTNPPFIESEIPSLYSTYYPRKNINVDKKLHGMKNTNSVLSKLIRWWNGTNNQGQYFASVGDKVLDIGCGSGISLLEAQAIGATTFGTEADSNLKPIAQSLGLNIHFGSLYERPFPEHSFDLIVMNQVIEHLSEPDLALKSLRERLKPNGRIVLVFPNTASMWRRLFGRRWINWHVPYHLHHFNLKNFKRMVTRCGFEVVRSRTITPNVWTVLQIRASSYSPEMGKPNPIWSVLKNSLLKPAERDKTIPLRKLLHFSAFSIIGLINRVVDAVGQGDSLLVELRKNAR